MKLKQAAFTLVEAVVAVGILSLVLVSIYGVFFSVMGSTKAGTAAVIEVQRQRIALQTIEDALSGLICYLDENNNPKQPYDFITNTEDFDYQSISFVSRVPPDFLGNNLFGSERLRRITFQVEDDELGGRSLVMYQTSILDPILETSGSNQSTASGLIDTQLIPDTQRWVIGPGLDLFGLSFWSTAENAWIFHWVEPDAPNPPTRIKVELAYTRDDGLETQSFETQKREVALFSKIIDYKTQNPPLPAAKSRGSGSRSRGSSSRGSSSRGKYTAEQIAAWRKKREEEAKKRARESEGKRKLPEGSRRVSDYGRLQNTAKRYDSNGDGILDPGERQKWRDDWAASRNNPSNSSRAAASAAGKAAGSGGAAAAAAAAAAGGGYASGSGDAGPSSSSGGSSRGGGGPSVLPGALVLNGELAAFEARTLQELVDMGVYSSMEDLQATAPEGAVWGIDPDSGLVVPVYP